MFDPTYDAKVGKLKFLVNFHDEIIRPVMPDDEEIELLPTQAFVEYLAYHYNPMGKKDPFKPLIKVEKKIAERMMIEGPLTPLQKYNLTELKLVAIVVGLGHPRAMVEDSKGDGYILSKGTFIGDSYGVVTEIKENEVVIVEKEVDPSSDEIVQREVSLILYKPEEE